MSKTVTLRLSDDVYQLFRQSAESDNRPLSNFIETATLRFIEQSELVDDSEMAEIHGNTSLNCSLDRGHTDARSKRGRFVD
ncbi:MAG: CopG family transcriptional regulator [Planctomycetota bacterium]